MITTESDCSNHIIHIMTSRIFVVNFFAIELYDNYNFYYNVLVVLTLKNSALQVCIIIAITFYKEMKIQGEVDFKLYMKIKNFHDLLFII